MYLKNKRMVTFSAIAAAAIGLAATGLFLRPVVGQTPATPKPALKDRLEAARKWHEAIEGEARVGHGVVDPETRFVWSKRLMECEMDLAVNPQAKQKALSAHVERMKALRDRLHAAYRSGESPSRLTLAGDYYYADAQAMSGGK